jgi:predicted GNAT family acetyltransferase
MRVIDYPDGASLLARARHLLEANEAENNLQLGICAVPATSPATAVPGLYLATVEDDAGAIAAVATWTPPHNLVISRAPAAAVAALAQDLRARGLSPPGVLAPDETAQAFAEQWSRPGGSWRVTMHQRIYQLTSVEPPARVSGRIREAARSDLATLAGWFGGFATDAGLDPISDAAGRAMAERRLEQGSLFVWEDGNPVSMAATVGPTPRGIRINLVYTPRALRRRGYASACVAALSQRMLDSGRTFCFLYADLANPTSNGIYQRMGYERVADVSMITFAA